MNNTPIDFVIIWVDGSDKEWQSEKEKYTPPSDSDNREERYRDWDNLRYWFRGAEKFAPWVRKIHFVTWGHLPKWLNTDDPKLNIVRHSDFIPEKYLPTFSSHTIELNLHRIEGLSDNFVYFNDDTFLINNVKPEDFFRKGLPCDSGILNVHCYSKSLPIQLIAINDTGVINEHFSIKDTLRAKPLNWLSPKYGKMNIRTLPLMFCPRFPGFYQPHLPTSLKKSTLEEVWSKEYDVLDGTCMHKFRCRDDVNQWVFREWQLASNDFYPRSINFGKSFFPDRDGLETFERIAEYISAQKGRMVCFNDCTLDEASFNGYKELINRSFEKILPERSEFEL
ncbi:MAG: stealth family protein [Huintestinicola sp.]